LSVYSLTARTTSGLGLHDGVDWALRLIPRVLLFSELERRTWNFEPRGGVGWVRSRNEVIRITVTSDGPPYGVCIEQRSPRETHSADRFSPGREGTYLWKCPPRSAGPPNKEWRCALGRHPPYQFSLGSVIVFTGDHFTASGIGFNASQLLRGTPWDIGVL
jgi:hypothetical protein